MAKRKPKLTYEDRLKLDVANELIAEKQTSTKSMLDAATIFLNEATQEVPWQRAFIEDPSTWKSIIGSRRLSKSTILAIAGIYEALRYPYLQLLYIGLTQESCERAMSDQILPRLLRKHNLPAKLIGGNELRFHNGSILYMIGIDANKKQKDKVRGIKSGLNLIDEMQSFTQDVKLIIQDVIGPAAADTKARTIAAGTAGNALGENYWYEVTKDASKTNAISQSVKHPEWKVYWKSWEDNTSIDEQTNQKVCDNVREYLEEYRTLHPGIELTPSYRQEWNAEWIIETSALIYRYTNANLLTDSQCIEIGTSNRIPAATPEFLATATYILGFDTGYNDPTAFTVIAYNLKYSNKLYVIETFQKSHMEVPELVAKIRQLDQKYKFATMVGDSSNLQLIETLRGTYGLPLVKANKLGKLSHILTLNGDLQTRSVVFMPGNDELTKQLSTLIWDSKKLKVKDTMDGKEIVGEYEEIEGVHNDLADSFLYAHHYSRQHWYHTPKIKPLEINITSQQRYTDLTKQLMNRNKQQSVFGNIDFAEPNRSK